MEEWNCGMVEELDEALCASRNKNLNYGLQSFFYNSFCTAF